MNKFKINGDIKIDDIIYSMISEDNLDYFEYSNISRSNKLLFTTNKIKKIKEDEDSIMFSVSFNGKVSSIWVINKDKFDSEIFGISIYRINYLLIFESNIEAQKEIIKESINYLKNIIAYKKLTSYFLIGLNSNSIFTANILNYLIEGGFYYINTLLTFKMHKDEFVNLNFTNISKIKVREVNESDVNFVVDLAKKSFKYSRFHLDPYLDNEKANILVSTSAKNSILEKFVDVMYVAELNNKIVGYYSAKKKYIPEYGLIIGDAIISAVDEDYRGLGIFKELNTYLLKWFFDNTDIAEMGTYIANLPVHRTWNKNGLEIIRGVHQLALFIQY